jgi:hypothetical protein
LSPAKLLNDRVTSKPAPANADLRPDANWLLAVAATVAVPALHFYFLTHAGGLWRDEVNSLNLAQGDLKNIAHDSFPVLFPLLLRGWSDIGLAQSDISVRCLGVLIGLGMTGVFWLAAWWTRRAPPLWALALVTLNAWVMYYAASLRAYGLGSALIALGAAAAWRFVENPNRKNWLLFALTATLSVQTLFQNSMLVAGICAGACVVALRRKNFKLVAGVFLAGLTAAISLLPYLANLTGMAQGASPLRLDFDRVIALNDLDTLLAYPLPVLIWLWMALVGYVLLRAVASFFLKISDERFLFAAMTLAAGLPAFWLFLRLANFPVQPWYFLPPVALAAVCLDATLPRPAGRFRAPFFGGLAALMVISAMFAPQILNARFTNVDLAARRISALAGKKDFAVVTPWQVGITFAHYFNGACDWTTVPPMADHSVHRFDLIQLQMANTNAMQPVLEKISATLRAGGAVWVVGGINEYTDLNYPAALPPPPLRASGWNETPYRITWNNQLGWLLHWHATKIENFQKLTPDAGENEVVTLEKVTGWKD